MPSLLKYRTLVLELYVLAALGQACVYCMNILYVSTAKCHLGFAAKQNNEVMIQHIYGGT